MRYLILVMAGFFAVAGCQKKGSDSKGQNESPSSPSDDTKEDDNEEANEGDPQGNIGNEPDAQLKFDATGAKAFGIAKKGSFSLVGDENEGGDVVKVTPDGIKSPFSESPNFTVLDVVPAANGDVYLIPEGAVDVNGLAPTAASLTYGLLQGDGQMPSEGEDEPSDIAGAPESQSRCLLLRAIATDQSVVCAVDESDFGEQDEGVQLSNLQLDSSGIYFNVQKNGNLQNELYQLDAIGNLGTVCSQKFNQVGYFNKPGYTVASDGVVLYLEGDLTTQETLELRKCAGGTSTLIAGEVTFFDQFASGDWFYIVAPRNGGGGGAKLFDPATGEIDSKFWMATKVSVADDDPTPWEDIPLAEAYHNIYLGDSECMNEPAKYSAACSGNLDTRVTFKSEGKTISVAGNSEVFELHPMPKSLFVMEDVQETLGGHGNSVVVITSKTDDGGDSFYDHKLKLVDLETGTATTVMDLDEGYFGFILADGEVYMNHNDEFVSVDLDTGAVKTEPFSISKVKPYKK